MNFCIMRHGPVVEHYSYFAILLCICKLDNVKDFHKKNQLLLSPKAEVAKQSMSKDLPFIANKKLSE